MARAGAKNKSGLWEDEDFSPDARLTDMGPAAVSRRERPLSRRRGCLWAAAALLVLALAGGAALLVTGLRPVRAAALEAGQTIRAELFAKNGREGLTLGPEAARIDTGAPGTYKVPVIYRGKTYEAKLTIVDTVPPTATGRVRKAALGTTLAAADFVEDVRDATAVTAAWQQPPDIESMDPQTAVVRLTDAGGNYTDVQVQVTLVFDTTAPVIQGVKNIEALLGESVAYRQGVTVTDDTDPNPVLTVDNSGVDLSAPGVYTVYYTATDAAGNTASASATLTLREKPADYVDEQTVYAAAQAVYDEIITDGMTDMEKAFAIYHWVKYYIDYWDGSPLDYWTVGAYQAFTQRGGDCYTYFAAAKALLNMAGIDNIEVDKVNTSRSRHYWLLVDLGDGWYHLDPCPRKGDAPDNSFMLTDAELDAYSKAHDDSNPFDPTLYPARATRSVQYMVDYDEMRIVGENGSVG